MKSKAKMIRDHLELHWIQLQAEAGIPVEPLICTEAEALELWGTVADDEAIDDELGLWG